MDCNCTPSLTIVSPLGTIDVDFNSALNRREIDRLCCNDEKVWITGQDTCPWYLNDKVSVTSPLKKQVINQWACETLNIYLDTDLLVDKDEKVAVDSDCDAVYLKNALSISDNEYFDWNKSNCTMQLRIKPKCLFQMDIWYAQDLVTWVFTDNSTQYWVLPFWTWNISEYTIPTSICDWTAYYKTESIIFPDDNNDPTNIQTVRVIEVPEDWKYDISFGWEYEIGRWIASVRQFVWIIDSSSNIPRYLIEHSFVWPNYQDLDSNWQLDSNELYYYLDWVWVAPWAQIRWWLARSLNRIPFSWSRSVWLEAWTKIFHAYKVSTRTGEVASPDVLQLKFYGNGWAWGSIVSWWSWVYLSVMQVPVYRLTD